MKLNEEKLDNIIGWTIIVSIVGSLGMCLNLYLRLGDLEYKVNQTNENLYAAIQTLSTDVHTLKYSKSTNQTGQFE